MAVYHVGDLIRFSSTFTVGSTLTDPTVVTFEIRPPDGTIQTFTSPNASLINDSAGKWHLDYDVTLGGHCDWRWSGTGAAQAAIEGSVNVEPTSF